MLLRVLNGVEEVVAALAAEPQRQPGGRILHGAQPRVLRVPLGGVAAPGAPGNMISHGDLIFNFSGSDLAGAQGDVGLIGIQFDSLNDAHRRVTQSANIYGASLFSLVEAVSSISLAIILWYGGGQILTGVLAVGAERVGMGGPSVKGDRLRRGSDRQDARSAHADEGQRAVG